MNPEEPMAKEINKTLERFVLRLRNERKRFAIKSEVMTVKPVRTNGMDIKCGCKSPSKKLKYGNSWIVKSRPFPPASYELVIRELFHHHQKSSGLHTTISFTR
tara:strand:- start:80 stop:388 length:309 start_codon:yes stop_codon:yes gene_type:complete